MPSKVLLVHVDNNEESGDRVRIAASLANRLGAVLIGSAAAQIQPPIGDPSGYIDGSLVELEREDVERELAEAGTQFQQVAGTVQAGTEWRSGIVLPNLALAQDARSADLLIIGRSSSDNRGVYRTPSAGDLVMEIGRPLLLVPEGLTELNLERVLVAWKDTRETRRAVLDALPLLALAKEVVVLAVRENEDDDEERIGAEDVSAYLQRHGINSHASCTPLQASSVVDEILNQADTLNADLIVAGAYGRGRLREWIFGGVTSTLLAQTPKACLLSH